MSLRIELGCPGHFIGVRDCHYRRHTQVGNYRVSTVGDYYPLRGTRETLGSEKDSFFETMVFETTGTKEPKNDGCGCRALKSLSALDCVRYRTAGEAQAGHERLVAKYSRRRAGEPPQEGGRGR